ncbi:MAG TPA: TetR family transcriptional regulator [Oceanicaulis sp.]|nr:TetR family transcriptional regulator [Oceanicaulis sp.]
MRQENTLRRRGRRRADAPDGREALIRAATRHFADFGYEAAGLRAIAKAANVAPNLVAVHFGGKEGLWQACVDSFGQMLEGKIAALQALAADEQMSARDRLELIIRMTASFYDQSADVRGFIARGSLEPVPKGQIIAEQLLQPLYEAARPLIQQGIDEKIIPIQDPALVFVMINATLGQPDRMATALAVLSPDTPRDHVSERVGEALTRLLLN